MIEAHDEAPIHGLVRDGNSPLPRANDPPTSDSVRMPPMHATRPPSVNTHAATLYLYLSCPIPLGSTRLRDGYRNMDRVLRVVVVVARHDGSAEDMARLQSGGRLEDPLGSSCYRGRVVVDEVATWMKAEEDDVVAGAKAILTSY